MKVLGLNDFSIIKLKILENVFRTENTTPLRSQSTLKNENFNSKFLLVHGVGTRLKLRENMFLTKILFLNEI